MPTQTSAPKDKNSLIMDPGRRRSMRVLLSVPIVVSGKNAENQAFTEDARTLVVNAHGALIALAARVLPNQEVTVANKATRQSLECRVVHVGNPQGGKMQLGIEFVKPSPSFWQIDFPPDDWIVPED
jgi:PilZ domain